MIQPSDIILIVAIVVTAVLLVKWIWNTTVVKAVNWANKIDFQDALKLLVLFALFTGSIAARFH
jgi:hypothetical protein